VPLRRNNKYIVGNHRFNFDSVLFTDFVTFANESLAIFVSLKRSYVENRKKNSHAQIVSNHMKKYFSESVGTDSTALSNQIKSNLFANTKYERKKQTENQK